MPQISKRQDLIESGLQLVHQQGYGGCGVAAVSAAAGAPKGSFYNHFTSKDDFARVIIDRYLDQDRHQLAELANDTGRPAVERLRSYFRWMRDHAAEDGCSRGCLLGNLAAEAAATNDSLRHTLSETFDEWTTLLGTLVDQGAHDGSITASTPPARLAGALIDAWEGALLRAKTERTADALTRFLELTLPALTGPRAGRRLSRSPAAAG